MVTFKQFIVEASSSPETFRLTSLSQDAIQAWVEKNAPKYFQRLMNDPEHLAIWRGMPSSVNIGTIDTRKFTRTAANTSNIGNLWFSNHPSWKDYPPRSSSYICTVDRHYASSYEDVFLIIPADDAKIGICSGHDLWYSFNQFIENVSDDFGDFISDVHKLMKMLGHTATSYSELVDSLKKMTIQDLDNLVDSSPEVKYSCVKNLVQYMDIAQYDNLYRLFVVEFDPSHNGFSHCTGATFTPHSDNEVWVCGDVLAINRDVMANLFKPTSKTSNSFLADLRQKMAVDQ